MRPNGFTLVELLVALTLIALLSGGLFATLRTGMDGAARVESITGTDADLRLLYRFLSRRLATARPDTVYNPQQEVSVVRFEGGDRELFWVGDMPAHLPPGGLFELSLRHDANGRLVFAYRPYTQEPENKTAPRPPVIERILAEDVRGLTLAYAEAVNGQTVQWRPDWRRKDTLPKLVRMQVQLAEAPAVEFVFAPKISQAQ